MLVASFQLLFFFCFSLLMLPRLFVNTFSVEHIQLHKGCKQKKNSGTGTGAAKNSIRTGKKCKHTKTMTKWTVNLLNHVWTGLIENIKSGLFPAFVRCDSNLLVRGTLFVRRVRILFYRDDDGNNNNSNRRCPSIDAYRISKICLLCVQLYLAFALALSLHAPRTAK